MHIESINNLNIYYVYIRDSFHPGTINLKIIFKHKDFKTNLKDPKNILIKISI